MNITELTVHELQEKLNAKELTISDITKAYAERIKEKEQDVGAFVTVLADEAIEKSKEIEDKVNKGECKSTFAGIPIGIKDNLCTKGIKPTCSSKMLENFVPPYNATVIEKLNACDYVPVGKVNMDRNSTKTLQEENAETAYHDTHAWISQALKDFKHTKPILTPRFIPSCSNELMRRIKDLQNEFNLPVQSHLSENLEIFNIYIISQY